MAIKLSLVLTRRRIVQLNANLMHILTLLITSPAFGMGGLRTLPGATAPHQMPSSIAVGNGVQWQQVCRFSSTSNAVSESQENSGNDLQPAYIVTHEVH